MQLDIISDPVCPWCYIGKKRMELALASRPDLPIDLAYRVFQLDPDMPRGGMDRKEHLRRKFGESKGKGKVMDDGKVQSLDVKKGNRILFGKYSGTEVKIDGEEYLIMREDDILGVIE